MQQEGLFPEVTGRELADIAQKRVLSAEDEAWKVKATRYIRGQAAKGIRFTAEDVRVAIGDPTHPNSLGAILGQLSKADEIYVVGYTEADRSSSKGRILRVWKGTKKSR